jgi:hypothetical protein
MSELRLEARDFAGPGRWRWVLTGPGGTFLADHEVRLDTGYWQFEAFTGLVRYLRWRVSPDRRIGHEAEIVADVGAWIGEQVLGPVGPAMALELAYTHEHAFERLCGSRPPMRGWISPMR